MKNIFFTALCLIGSHCTMQAMENMEDNREILQSYIVQTQLHGPTVLVATYLMNNQQEVLLGYNNVKSIWSVPIAPCKSVDLGMKGAARRIISQVTGIDNSDVEYIGHQEKFNIPVSINNEKLVHSFVIHMYKVKNIPSDVQFREPHACDEMNFSCCDSWQWFDKNNLPKNITKLTLREFE
ncbi:MAG: hypothetical protein Q8Q60_04545 [Candidatus Chromulinivorax sp.]|nr:hypothetical protein [Candidatus Chromulinivorax sp.]